MSKDYFDLLDQCSKTKTEYEKMLEKAASQETAHEKMMREVAEMAAESAKQRNSDNNND